MKVVPVGARSHHDHAAFGREVRLRRSTRPRADCTASACRWSMPCRNCSRSKSPAAESSIASASRAERRSRSCRNSARSTIGVGPHPLQARPRHLRQERRLQAGAPLRHDPLQGLPLRRRRDPLAVRRGAPRRQGRRSREGDFPLSRRALGLPRGRARRREDHRADLRRPDREAKRPWRGRMGDRLVSRRRLSPLLLQHHPDRRRRDARGGPALGADQGA